MEKQTGDQALINNDFYETLCEDWYAAYDHPVALLRAENQIRTPWILAEIEKHFQKPVRLLDIGCGAGLLTNAAAKKGHEVTGIDLSANSLSVAKQHDTTQSVHYECANALDLPFAEGTFDVVTAMDVLEHVEHPDTLIQEASRMLKPNGLFFFHTFNRNLLSYLLVIKGVEWFVRNAPPHMHVYSLFIRPQELQKMCEKHHLIPEKWIGLRPKIGNWAFFKLLSTRVVPPDFQFCFSKSLSTGYCGIARKFPLNTRSTYG